MQQCDRPVWLRNLKTLGWVGSGAIAALLVGWEKGAIAQITPDNTLGTQVNGSLTVPCTGVCLITNGSQRNRNLFHSFRQFSLSNGGIAGFITTPDIQNVIVRVTGQGAGFVSNINGTILSVSPTLTTLNPVNLFLLNPNGIVFGPNARLLNGGSFLATTAERMLFQDGTVLNTRDQTVAPLLTVSIPVGLQFGQTPGAIQLQGSRLLADQNNSFKDFALVGGDITLDNATVSVPGQRLELVGVGENGTVELKLNGDRLNLSLAADAPRQDITLNRSIVTAGASSGGGEVAVIGRNIIALDGSLILTGIPSGADNAVTNRAGDITIDATANLKLTQSSVIANLVNLNAIGQGGNTNITAADIQVRDGSVLGVLIFGNGNVGNVRVTANSIALDGIAPNGRQSAISSQVLETGSGRGGDVTVQTGSLTVTNGARVVASTGGNGDTGNVRVSANAITLDGPASGISSQIFETGSGRGGDVTVQTGSLTVTKGAVVSANTLGNGDAGNIEVIANAIVLDGIAPDGRGASGIGSLTRPTSSGRGGNITVQTGSLTTTNGAGIFASTAGKGDAGNVRVTADSIALNTGGIATFVFNTGSGRGGDISLQTGSLTVTNGAGISAGTAGKGDAGNVRVTADSIALSDNALNGQPSSGIVSQVDPTGSGRSGDLIVESRSLTLTNGAAVSASTFGNGDAGDVQVKADTIALDGAASGIGSQVGSTGNGRGGNVTLESRSLTVTNGAGVSASTFGKGDAGNVQVRANTIALDGDLPNGQGASGIGSQVGPTGSGRGGDVTVQADLLTITNGAVISSSAFGSGSAGNLNITAQTLRLDRGGITAVAFSGDGANINLTLGNLLLMRRTSQISTSAGLAQAGGNGGNITINAPNGFLVTAPKENNDITANAFNGSGGRVTINTQGIYNFTTRSRAELAKLLGTNDPARLNPQLLPTNDITAISQGSPNLNGTTTINTPDVDPSRGLIALPIALADASNRIAQRCPQRGSAQQASAFYITGRGGLPQRPGDLPLSVYSTGTVQTIPGSTASTAVIDRTEPTAAPAKASIVEADRLTTGPNGSLWLVAQAPTGSSGLPWLPAECAPRP